MKKFLVSMMGGGSRSAQATGDTYRMDRCGRRVQDELKRRAGVAAAAEVQDGDVVGLGTGSTVQHTIVELGRRVRDEGLSIRGIPTSEASARLAQAEGIPLTDLDHDPVVTVTIDGADELDDHLNLIKGGGGALTREKIVAKASTRLVVVADESKRVQVLGSTFPLPVEVIRLGQRPVLDLLTRLGAEAAVRVDGAGGPVLTDNGHPIIDARFQQIDDPVLLEQTLCMYPGVVECGLFLGLCDRAYVAGANGLQVVDRASSLGPKTTAQTAGPAG